jgi:hypothetical protein
MKPPAMPDSKSNRSGKNKREIFHRLVIVYQAIKFEVGLLRMITFNTSSASCNLSFRGSDTQQLDGWKENIFSGGFKELVFPDAGSSPA